MKKNLLAFSLLLIFSCTVCNAAVKAKKASFNIPVVAITTADSAKISIVGSDLLRGAGSLVSLRIVADDPSTSTVLFGEGFDTEDNFMQLASTSNFFRSLSTSRGMSSWKIGGNQINALLTVSGTSTMSGGSIPIELQRVNLDKSKNAIVYLASLNKKFVSHNLDQVVGSHNKVTVTLLRNARFSKALSDKTRAIFTYKSANGIEGRLTFHTVRGLYGPVSNMVVAFHKVDGH